MALGYCKLCDKFCPITAGERKINSLQRNWYPVPHEDPKTMKSCKGDKVAI